MDSDATLDWILRLARKIDRDLEEGRSPKEDAVYALVGLVLELDVWLEAGHQTPKRWIGKSSQPVVLPAVVVPSNDVVPTGKNAGKPRKTRVAAKDTNKQAKNRSGAVAPEQLPLPFAANLL